MKKILLTNNSTLIDNSYDIIYTDSPYVVERFNKAIYLEKFLPENIKLKINNIQKKGKKINQEISKIFFPNFENPQIEIIDIGRQFTNIYMCVVKLLKFIEAHTGDEITISITTDELYKYENPLSLDRFANIYYWIADIIKFKNIKLLCKKFNFDNLHQDHFPIKSWFLKLIDLDKKILIFNFLKKIKFIKKNNKTKIYLFKKSNVIREIEPYLFDLGFILIEMPKINFNFVKNHNSADYKQLAIILDNYLDNDQEGQIFKKVLFLVCKNSIEYNLQKKKITESYISKLDKKIKFILTNTLAGFDSQIFAKQLQKNFYKIINVMHGLSIAFRKKEYVTFLECESPDLTLCFNNSEKELFHEFLPNSLIQPISKVQEAKKKRFRFLKRKYINYKFKLDEKINIFYPSIIYPYNNFTRYGFRQSDRLNYNFEKDMILTLSKTNKRVFYKNYPKRCYIDPNPLIKFAKSFNNIHLIDNNHDFRYFTSLGDIFILGSIGSSSTWPWMFGENKPIIYLHTNKFRFINNKGKEIVNKIFLVVDIDQNNWIDKLVDLLNKPYEELLMLWQEKEIFRKEFDVNWLLGSNLHAGKTGAQLIKEFIHEN